MIVEEHLDQLLSLLPIGSSADIANLCELHDQVQLSINSLEGLGAPTAQYGSFLNRVLLHLLPVDCTSLYRQKMKELEVTAQEEESQLESSPH